MAAANVLKGGGVLLVSCRNHAGNVLSTSSSVPFRTGVKTEGSKRGMFWRHLSFCAVTTSSSTPAPPPPPPPADASSPPPPLSSDDGDPIKDAASMLDIRVGLVLKAWRHEEADSLYVEEVDVGEPEPRIICSGLVKYVPLDHLQVQNYCSGMCLLRILSESLANAHYIKNLVSVGERKIVTLKEHNSFQKSTITRDAYTNNGFMRKIILSEKNIIS